MVYGIDLVSFQAQFLITGGLSDDTDRIRAWHDIEYDIKESTFALNHIDDDNITGRNRYGTGVEEMSTFLY